MMFWSSSARLTRPAYRPIYVFLTGARASALRAVQLRPKAGRRNGRLGVPYNTVALAFILSNSLSAHFRADARERRRAEEAGGAEKF
jgi:hypothetical protein